MCKAVYDIELVGPKNCPCSANICTLYFMDLSHFPEEDDLGLVLQTLVEVLSERKPIGVGFGLKLSKLNEIEETHHGTPKKCFLDVVTYWLNQNYNISKFGEPSWRKVVEVVASPAAGDNMVLATSIAQNHLRKCILDVYTVRTMSRGL